MSTLSNLSIKKYLSEFLLTELITSVVCGKGSVSIADSVDAVAALTAEELSQLLSAVKFGQEVAVRVSQ